MKTRLKLIWITGIIAAVFSGCEYDNYDEPGSMLQGKIVYNGEAINVSYNDVNMQLWEPGWQKKYPIDVAVAQDGSYSAMLFNGTYKLVIPAAQGPFRSKLNQETNSDTILVNLKGSQTLDIEVEPYYMIRNPQFTVSGRAITGTFGAEKIVTDAGARNIERVYLYVNKTQFVDFRSNVASADIVGADLSDPDAISMTVTVPDLTPTQSYVYARVGLRIEGVEDMIFSPVTKVDL